MLMRKFVCEVILKHSMDDDAILCATIWVPDTEEFMCDIEDLVWKMGYEMVPGGEIYGTDEMCDLDPEYIDDRFEFVEDE